MRKDTTMETGLLIKAYKRTKRQSLRDARSTAMIEKRQQDKAERERKEQHQVSVLVIISDRLYFYISWLSLS